MMIDFESFVILALRFFKITYSERLRLLARVVHISLCITYLENEITTQTTAQIPKKEGSEISTVKPSG